MNEKVENFLNISIIVSILILFFPFIEYLIEKIGSVIIYITKNTVKTALYVYFAMINLVWIYLFCVIFNDSRNKYIELDYSINVEQIKNITRTHFQDIFKY